MQHVRKKERKKERQPANYTHRKYNATYFVTRYQAQYIVETLFAIRHSPFSISPFSTPPFPTLLITVHRIVIPLFPALPSSSSHMVLRDPASSHLISSHLISASRNPVYRHGVMRLVVRCHLFVLARITQVKLP